MNVLIKSQTGLMYNSWNYPGSVNEKVGCKFIAGNAPVTMSSRFIVFYGSDLALSLSLSREDHAEFWSEEACKKNFTQLISADIFSGEKGPIRSIVSDKTASWLCSMRTKYTFQRDCHLIVEGKISKEFSGVVYVKCDQLNARSRGWFLNFHTKRMGLPNEKLQWVNNLDDLRFAQVLEKLGFSDYVLEKPANLPDIWSQMRIDQFKKKPPVSSLCKHFELWARNNSTGDEFLELMYEKAIGAVVANRGKFDTGK